MRTLLTFILPQNAVFVNVSLPFISLHTCTSVRCGYGKNKKERLVTGAHARPSHQPPLVRLLCKRTRGRTALNGVDHRHGLATASDELAPLCANVRHRRKYPAEVVVHDSENVSVREPLRKREAILAGDHALMDDELLPTLHQRDSHLMRRHTFLELPFRVCPAKGRSKFA